MLHLVLLYTSISLLAHASTLRRAPVQLRHDSEANEVSFNSSVDLAVDALLDGTAKHQTSLGLLARQGAAALDMQQTIETVAPPSHVMAALQQKAEPSTFDRAITMMNDLILKAHERLDVKVIECREFKLKNRQTMAQIETDLARFGQQIANSERVASTTLGQIDESVVSTQASKEEQEREKVLYTQQFDLDEAVRKVRQRDYVTASFILKATKCSAGLVQVDRGATVMTTNAVEACTDDATDIPELSFVDPQLKNLTEKLSLEGRQMLQFALGRASLYSDNLKKGRGISEELDDGEVDGEEVAEESDDDAEEDEDEDDEDDDDAEDDDTAFLAVGRSITRQTPTGLDALMGQKSPAGENKMAGRCVKHLPDCGILHDTFATIWGEMKDLVDETSTKIRKETREWENLNKGINTQIQSFATQRSELHAALGETTSMQTHFEQVQSDKLHEKRSVDNEYRNGMKRCRAVLRNLFSDMCRKIKVRNEVVVKTAPDEPAQNDCEVDDWVPGECSKKCDDTLAGGKWTLTRTVIVKKSKYGANCPTLTYSSICNQIKCPIDCVLSSWSGWSSCTAECGGGVQSRVRQQHQKPENAGLACDALQESRPCNKGSCDRDCTLKWWTQPGKCSQSCNRGRSIRTRSVLVKRRANGVCDGMYRNSRYRAVACNTHRCTGDEECLSRMNLVIALDGSGSITQAGFEILKNFTLDIIRRLRRTAYGHDAVHVGVVHFGNGVLDDDLVVSDAETVSEVSDDLKAVQDKVQALTWQKGFTNMAQAFTKAKLLFSNTLRSNAENVVLVITDGQPSFKLQTKFASRDLRKVARVVMAHVAPFPTRDTVKYLRKLVSHPHAPNLVRVPGKKKIKRNGELMVTRVLSRTCPRYESPSDKYHMAIENGFELMLEGSYCGPSQYNSTTSYVPSDCAAAGAMGVNEEAFEAFAFSSAEGKCLLYKKEDCTKESKESYDFYKIHAW
jgi:uncharacterized protein YegL